MKTHALMQRWIAVATALCLLIPTFALSQSADDVKRWHNEAEQGEAQAQYKLGLRYFYGLDVGRDKAEAVIWYNKAAAQGHKEAIAALQRLGGVEMASESQGKGGAAEKAQGAVFGDSTQEKPFVNSLGMKFVPVPIGAGSSKEKRVLFSIWETRVQDYAVYAAANPGVDMEWKDAEYEGHGQGVDHPVLNVSWEDSQAFCKWLTKKERELGRLGAGEEYSLPTDVEWSYAVGIGDKEDAEASHEEKDEKIEGEYPWGGSYPPSGRAGNYNETEEDGYAFTAPVGSYAANRYGLYDLGGNVWEWCEDWWNAEQNSRVLRGGSWFSSTETFLRSSGRNNFTPSNRFVFCGFRVVLGVGAGG